MKTLLFSSFIFLAITAGAQTKGEKPPYDNYCMQMVGGKAVVMYQGKILTHEVSLDNDARLKPDGSINKKGEKTMLKEGECVDPEGKVISVEKKSK